MASFMSILNRLLPFATPGTPLIQDLLHLAAFCALLYFGPQLQERFSHRHARGDTQQQPIEAGRGPQDQVPPLDMHEEPPQAQPPELDEGDRPIPLNEEDEAILDEPGPAQPRAVNDQRNVGAKKAKALARKDQRRAYNEFMRSQGDAQRARDAEGAEEREQAQAVERERRKLAESAYEAKRAKERQERKQKENVSRQETIRQRAQAIAIVREEIDSQGCCDLFRVAQLIGDDVDDEWIGHTLNSSGLLGKKGDSLTFVTKTGWAVRVSAANMAAVYHAAIENGSQADGASIVSADTLARLLDQQIRP